MSSVMCGFLPYNKVFIFNVSSFKVIRCFCCRILWDETIVLIAFHIRQFQGFKILLAVYCLQE